MKKNIAMRVASLVLMCTIVTSCFVSSTFAKYTSEFSGQDTVTVAKWDVSVTDGTNIINKNTDIDLFETITEVDGDGDQEVVAGLIAPGTKGSFRIVVSNSSDVDVNYSVKFTVNNGLNIPFKYSLDGNSWDTNVNNLTKSNKLEAAPANQNGERTATTADVVVYWMWPYETTDGDAIDTQIGTAAGEVTVNAAITATQANSAQ